MMITGSKFRRIQWRSNRPDPEVMIHLFSIWNSCSYADDERTMEGKRRDVQEVLEFSSQFRSPLPVYGVFRRIQLKYALPLPLCGGRRPGNTRRRVAVAAAKTCQQFSADFPPGSTRTHERGPRPRTSTLCRKKQQFRCGFCLFASSVWRRMAHRSRRQTRPLNYSPCPRIWALPLPAV